MASGGRLNHVDTTKDFFLVTIHFPSVGHNTKRQRGARCTMEYF